MDNSTDKIVSVFLKFGADQQSVQKSIADFKKIEGEIGSLEKEAQSLNSKITAALDHGDDVGELTADLKVVEGAISNLKKKADSELGQGLNSSFEKVAETAKKTGGSISQSFNLRDIGEKMNFVGMAMQSAGQGITNTLMGAVNAYLTASGQYSKEAQKWNAAQASMQNSFQRIGAVALEKLTPYIDKAASLLDKFASFVEQNPEIIGAIASLGAVLTVGGQLVSGLAQIAMIAGSLQGLGKIFGTGGALAGAGGAVGGALGTAGKVAAGFATGVGGAATAGVGVGLFGYQQLANSQAGQRAGLANLGQYASVAAYGAGKLFDEATAQRWFKSMGEMTGVIDKQASAASQYSNNFAGQNVQTFIDYQKQMADAAKQYGEQVKQVEADTEKQRIAIIRNFADQAAQAESQYANASAKAAQDYQSQTAKAASAYAKQERQAEQDYYKARADAAKSFGTEAKRMEEDHQRDMLKLQQDHNDRVGDLLAGGDALGLVLENRDYDRQRSDAESDYNTEAKRKKQDYAQQMADMEASFALARSRRRADYAQQVNDAREQYQAAQAERAQQHKAQMDQLKKDEAQQLQALQDAKSEQLSKLRTAYESQTRMMQTAFIDRLNAMSQSIQGNTAAWIAYMQGQSTAFDAWLKSKGYGASVPGRAGGGSVLDGMTYMVGENGPELFTAPADGTIIPAGLTSSLLAGNGRGQQQGPRTSILKIETSSLTMEKVIDYLDQRFATYDSAMSAAWEG